MGEMTTVCLPSLHLSVRTLGRNLFLFGSRGPPNEAFTSLMKCRISSSYTLRKLRTYICEGSHDTQTMFHDVQLTHLHDVTEGLWFRLPHPGE